MEWLHVHKWVNGKCTCGESQCQASCKRKPIKGGKPKRCRQAAIKDGKCGVHREDKC